MPTLERFTNKRHAGLASYTSQVALGPARVVSSYARRIFHKHYEDKHRHPRVIFVFDAALLGICALLVAVLVSIATRPLRPPALTLNLTSPVLVSGTPVPLIAQIGTTKIAHNVRLQWHLPPGTEIISSEPHVSADGRVFLGDLTPGATRPAHLVVRLFQPVDATASFGFTLSYEENGVTIDEVGSEDRKVTGSALMAYIPKDFEGFDGVPSHGGMIPLVVDNASATELPYVQVTFDPVIPELGERVTMGNLAAHEKRYIFVPLHPESDNSVRVNWIVSSAAREVSRGTWGSEAGTPGYDENLSGLTIDSPLTSRPNSETHIRVTVSKTHQALLVVHPLLEPAIRRIELTEGLNEIVLPEFTSERSPAHEWFVAPISYNVWHFLGPATMGVIKSAIPFETAVRFTSSEGDQIGAGPNPPKVGEDTRYWVFWKIGPVSDEVRDVRVSATLPARVRATGNITSPNGGSSDISGSSVTWSLPRLGGTEASEVLFGFEVEVRPNTTDSGRPIMVVATSTATAADMETDTTFRMQTAPGTSGGPVLP